MRCPMQILRTWCVLDTAHRKRNLAEYEGYFEVEESTVDELCILVKVLITEVELLVGD